MGLGSNLTYGNFGLRKFLGTEPLRKSGTVCLLFWDQAVLRAAFSFGPTNFVDVFSSSGFYIHTVSLAILNYASVK